MTRNSIKKMVEALIKNKATAVSCLTLVSGTNYLSKAMNMYRKNRYSTGKKSIIGTPTLFVGNILRKNNFNKTHEKNSLANITMKSNKPTISSLIDNKLNEEINKIKKLIK
jgi:hypothetical protein